MIVVGIGARSGVPPAGPVLAALAEAGLTAGEVDVLATLDRRAAEERMRALARAYGWRLAAFPANVLAAVEVPHPGAVAAAAVGTPSVAEAAAILAAGPAPRLIMPKWSRDGVTVAIARSDGADHTPVPAQRRAGSGPDDESQTAPEVVGHSCTGMFSCISGR